MSRDDEVIRRRGFGTIEYDKETKLKKWREGEVIQIDIVPDGYHEMYLFSDGTISETRWED